MFGLSYWYGLRAVELTMLLREDLDLTRRRIRITRAKGGVTAEYVLEDENLVRALKRYLRARIDRGPYLFTGRESTNQRGVRELTVRRLFKKYAAAAGLAPKVASHALRHSIAVHLLEGKESLAAVAILLGHKQLRSSEVYAKITEPAREGLLQRMKKNPAIVSVPRPR